MERQETARFKVTGMTCPVCESRIEQKLCGLPGVRSVRADYAGGAVEVTYVPGPVDEAGIAEAVRSMGYGVEQPGDAGGRATAPVAGALLLILAGYMLLRYSGILSLFRAFPQAEAGMGYGMLFVVGLLTSVHCVAMCGGINLSQCIGGCGGKGKALLRPSLLYNGGRILAYTFVGGVVGALGSVISFTGFARGLVQIVAGVFMAVMALNMLGLFPGLRRLIPRLPRGLRNEVAAQAGESRSPLVVGLLTGLMPCGPLQAMQLYALSTGSPVKGALSMLVFGLGTAPLLFGFGALGSLLSHRFTRRVMGVGAMLVLVMGISMLSNGLSLSGVNVFAAGGQEATGAQVSRSDGVQYITTALEPGRYPPITVQEGIPVVWTITAAQGTVNGCNNRIFIPEYGIEQALAVGETTISFTPERAGTFTYSCWMGMIRSTISVTGEDGVAPPPEEQDIYPQNGPGCCRV